MIEQAPPPRPLLRRSRGKAKSVKPIMSTRPRFVFAKHLGSIHKFLRRPEPSSQTHGQPRGELTMLGPPLHRGGLLSVDDPMEFRHGAGVRRGRATAMQFVGGV